MKLAVGLTFAAILTSVVSVQAEEKQPRERPPESLGFVEWVVLQDTGLRLKARLDTGARTSSLHAVNIEPFEKGDEKWVSFQVPLADHRDQEKGEKGTQVEDVILEFERPVDRTVRIKRKGAPSQRRYVVRMEFCIAGSTHETEFSLADRGRFSYPALLGRRFLSDDNILVASSESFMAENECEHNNLDELAQNGKNLAK
ncbi:ATP-dependent zinc protease [Marinobacter sp. NP-4(2019)]|uniref:ATP-dependent zinc protease family protein n=1 Tax=Marinobacter sp. NP-4(2019) TaxID=2488665 RepID=UPI000FC3CD29|nr:ATP-dependent zinc protease [Marinobacter sp. NP-4(2019)]AZT83910.1 ATP-dependent zinc protease [Marinobacter sp. NP-4(2019)]